MRLSNYLFKTIKETPKDAELKSHKLLLRGGYIKQVSAGIFTYFPIAWKALKKIEKIIREEMDKTGCLEINMPVVMPASLWMETGRYDGVGEELLRFEDRTGRKMVLGMTHEEAVTDLIRYAINSYKQLPIKVYQIQTKFRDEPRVRGGLIRVREFVMKDAYSFHTTTEDLDNYYDEVYQAYHNIFRRCGLNVIAVSSDTGMMGGSKADEFMAITESGEDTLILCSKCDYKANKEVAKAKRDYIKEKELELKEVHTPDKMTIEEVANYLGIPESKTLKAIVYSTGKDLVMCVIRGDLDINETKLKNYLKTKTLFMATDEELNAINVVKGYASPIGAKIRVIADISAKESSNLVTGANKKDYHIMNCNFGRDWATDEVVDISSVNEGEKCPICGGFLNVKRGIEVGNIFKLGTKYSSSMKAKFLDKDGKEKDMIMGCYGIGVGRLLASVLEINATENAIIWPITIAPFEIELIGLYNENNKELKDFVDNFYSDLIREGFDVVYDDRAFSPGFKFKDADLIGSPIKIAIGEKSYKEGCAEVTVEDQEKQNIKIIDLIKFLKEIRIKLFDKYK